MAKMPPIVGAASKAASSMKIQRPLSNSIDSVVTNNTSMFGPPNAQLVTFSTGNSMT
jgi:hypothetical protein